MSASVVLTSPTNTVSFTAPATHNLAAVVSTNANLISNVQFYANATNLIGQDSTPPYTYNWTNIGTGSYLVRDRVNFNGSRYADSAAVNVIVSNLPPPIQTIGLNSGNVSLDGTGQAGQTFVLLSPSNLVPPIVWMPLMTNQSDGSGRFAFTNLATTNAQQFYRISAP